MYYIFNFLNWRSLLMSLRTYCKMCSPVGFLPSRGVEYEINHSLTSPQSKNGLTHRPSDGVKWICILVVVELSLGKNSMCWIDKLIQILNFNWQSFWRNIIIISNKNQWNNMGKKEWKWVYSFSIVKIFQERKKKCPIRWVLGLHISHLTLPDCNLLHKL